MNLKEWCKQNNWQDLIEQYSDRNEKDMTRITYGSGLKVWWKCLYGHEWEATPNNRTNHGVGCPYCSGRKIMVGFNDLQTLRSDIADEWHPTKNGDLKPSDVGIGNGKKVWWKCKYNHEWEAVVGSRVKGAGCPYCARQRVISGVNDLQTIFPDVAAEWHPTKNGKLKPTDIMSQSGKKVWWLGKCGHEWEASISNRSKGKGCPYCANKKVLTGYNDLQTKFPRIAKEWNYNKNGDIHPSMILPGIAKEVWWKCLYGHEWRASPNARTSTKSGCPYCAGQRAISGVNDLQTVFSDIAAEWHPTKNGKLKPTDIMARSGKKVWWLGKCGHEWQAIVGNRTTKDRGCPYCSKQKVLVGFNDLATTNPELLKEWDYTKNTILPTEIIAGSEKKVWWKCPFGHSYKSAVFRHIPGSSYRGCPICSKEMRTSFPEQALFFYIRKYYPEAVNSNRDVIGMELDIYIPSLKIAIEYDGVLWHKDNKNDLVKNNLCKDNDIFLIRVREEGLELFDDCFCVSRTDNRSNESLSEAIKQVMLTIDNTLEIDIDIDRDFVLICNAYVKGRKDLNLKNAYPDIADEWNPTKNGDLTPVMIAPKSNKKVWWKCQYGHEWQAIVGSRVRGNGCPVCGRRRTGDAHFKPVMCIDTGVKYESLKEASEKTGMSASAISACCKGKRHTAGGYRWKYVEE